MIYELLKKNAYIRYLHIAIEAQKNSLTPDDVAFAIDWLIDPVIKKEPILVKG